jgi:uncharacterized membrane protein YuzA (DUF378 family)
LHYCIYAFQLVYAILGGFDKIRTKRMAYMLVAVCTAHSVLYGVKVERDFRSVLEVSCEEVHTSSFSAREI